jgi:cytochrome oxidase Cu insertion factor (SCO1/SenC/PrrC family)
MRLRTYSLATVAAAILLMMIATPRLASAQSSPPATQPATGLKEGQRAPEINGKDVKGKPMKLSDFRGKVVVLDFFGDW